MHYHQPVETTEKSIRGPTHKIFPLHLFSPEEEKVLSTFKSLKAQGWDARLPPQPFIPPAPAGATHKAVLSPPQGSFGWSTQLLSSGLPQCVPSSAASYLLLGLQDLLVHR